MSDERMTPIVKAWLKGTAHTPYDPKEGGRHVMARVAQVRQRRRRWWSIPPLQRTVSTATATDTAEYQLSPVPASNGHHPTVIGRTTSMLSPVKAIIAGAIVAVIGGAFLMAQPFDQRVEIAPGAEAEFAPPVEVTGTLGDGGCSNTRLEGDETTLPGSDEQYTCTATWSMSDDRLSGKVTLINENFYLVGNGLEASEALSIACTEDPECAAPDLETFSSAMSVENDGGVWRQRPAVQISYPGSTFPDKSILVMDGEQGYDGLVAVLEATSTDLFADATYYGFILDARQLKAAPENASTD